MLADKLRGASLAAAAVPVVGTTWVNQASLSTVSFMRDTSPPYGIAYNGSNLYVAVGESGKCATSTDGINWTKQTGLATAIAPGATAMNSVTWNPTLATFLAVGNNGKCATSTDGVTWTFRVGLQVASGSTQMNAVVWAPLPIGLFVAVGQNGKCCTSPTGVTWTNRASFTTAFGSSNIAHDVITTGSLLVVVGSNGKCATSPGGDTWTNQAGFTGAGATSGQTMYGVAWNGSTLCAVGNGAKCVTSSGTAVTWTNRAGLPAQMGVVLCEDIVWTSSQFIATGGGGTCCSSPDGITWTSRTTPFSTAVGTSSIAPKKSIWTGSQIVTVGGSRSFAATSATVDGSAWVNRYQMGRAFGVPADQYDIAWNGIEADASSVFCAVGIDGQCATSPTGTTWTVSGNTMGDAMDISGVFASVNTPYKVIWDGSKFCAAGTANRFVTSNSTGTTWTNQPGLATALSASSANDVIRVIIKSPTQYVALGYTAANAPTCATSPDGVTWTNRTGISVWGVGSLYVRAGVWTGTQFVVVGDDSRCVTSPDGITWTRQTGFNATTFGTYAEALAWDGSKLCAIGGNRCATSTDGITWTRQTQIESVFTAGTDFLYGVVWTGGEFIAVGGSTTNVPKCATSPNGVTWTNRPSLASVAGTSTIKSLIFNGLKLVAVGTSAGCATSIS